MAVTVSLSARVSPELRQRLADRAKMQGIPLATLASELLAAGVDSERPSEADDVQNEVRCVFHHLPPGAGVHRAVAMSLARTVENGGGAQVAAAKELIDLCDLALRRWEPECWNYEDEDEDGNGEG